MKRLKLGLLDIDVLPYFCVVIKPEAMSLLNTYRKKKMITQGLHLDPLTKRYNLKIHNM